MRKGTLILLILLSVINLSFAQTSGTTQMFSVQDKDGDLNAITWNPENLLHTPTFQHKTKGWGFYKLKHQLPAIKKK